MPDQALRREPRRRILVAGAFDRFNFGDLLFPRILRRALRRLGDEAPLTYLATRAADLRPAGGVETLPLDSLRKGRSGDAEPSSRDLLLFAGGEVLDAGWAGTYAALSSPARAFAVKALDKVLGAEGLSRRLLGSCRALPWVPSQEEAGGASTAYWAVGGSGLTDLPHSRQELIRRNLSQAVDLSVRDPKTLATLQSWGLEARLAPDGAVLASDLFPKNEVLAKLSLPARELLDRLGDDYICLQLGRYPSRGHGAEIAAEVESLRAALGLPILLLPLGRAAAHEDEAALSQVHHRLKPVDAPAAPAVLPDAAAPPLTVTDLLALIASARLFAGTSLHGNLTALTYGVPRVGLGPHVRKLDLFLRTWDPAQPQGCAPFSELSSRASAALKIPSTTLEAIRQQVLAAAWDNLRQLLANTR